MSRRDVSQQLMFNLINIVLFSVLQTMGFHIVGRKNCLTGCSSMNGYLNENYITLNLCIMS